jgi:hypothetical protein
MIIKTIVDEDFVNYKKPAMFIAFPHCSFKCEQECGERVCQNSALALAPNIETTAHELVERYLKNPITQAIVCGGLEPMDSFEDLMTLIHMLRHSGCEDDVVVYTGYREDELDILQLRALIDAGNVIVKFGRYIPGGTPHFDPTLGVQLAGENQYAAKL